MSRRGLGEHAQLGKAQIENTFNEQGKIETLSAFTGEQSPSTGVTQLLESRYSIRERFRVLLYLSAQQINMILSSQYKGDEKKKIISQLS